MLFLACFIVSRVIRLSVDDQVSFHVSFALYLPTNRVLHVDSLIMPRAAGRGRGGRGANRGASVSVVVNHRPLRDTVIKPRYLWCMCCLRTAVGEFNPAIMEKQAPFVIDCILNAAGSVLCR